MVFKNGFSVKKNIRPLRKRRQFHDHDSPSWLQAWIWQTGSNFGFQLKVSFEKIISYTILISTLSIGRLILRAKEFGATQKISLLKSPVKHLYFQESFASLDYQQSWRYLLEIQGRCTLSAHKEHRQEKPMQVHCVRRNPSKNLNHLGWRTYIQCGLK